jgi:hypothetical protein
VAVVEALNTDHPSRVDMEEAIPRSSMVVGILNKVILNKVILNRAILLRVMVAVLATVVDMEAVISNLRGGAEVSELVVPRPSV